MTLSIQTGYKSANLTTACRCGAHALHSTYRWLWANPSGSLKAMSRDLKISYACAKQRSSRLKRRADISRRCPECWSPSLEGLTCRNCGVELDTPILPEGVRFGETSPVHTIQMLNGLGSVTNYGSLGLTYGARNVQHLAERPDDSFSESCKSRLWQELKEVFPDDGVTEEATRMLVKEIAEFRCKYPGLVRKKGVGDQLVSNVVARLALRYPALRRVTG